MGDFMKNESLLGYKVMQVSRPNLKKFRPVVPMTEVQIKKYRRKAIKSASKSAKLFLDLIECHFGIILEREFELQNKFFDAQYNDIIIEVDSDYWHKSKRQRANDIRKNDIAIRNGYKIYRFKVNGLRYSKKVFEINKEFLVEIFK